MKVNAIQIDTYSQKAVGDTASRSYSILVDGEKYIVELNGTRYEVTAWINDGDDAVYLGNGSIYGGLDKGDACVSMRRTAPLSLRTSPLPTSN